MRRTTAIASAIAALAGAAPAAHAGTTDAGTATCAGADAIATDEASREQASLAVLCLVNRDRAQHAAAPVRAAGQLASAATAHSTDMVTHQYFSHTSPTSGSLTQRVLRTGYVHKSRYALLGETIAWGSLEYATPDSLVAAFLESPEHRRIMLDKHYRDVGVGLVLGAPAPGVSDPAATVTLDFGRR